MKCPNCTHKREFIYSKGVRFCWHCKKKTLLTQEECDVINEENRLEREAKNALAN
jgi:predicted amidophosphoribosyltransferase